MKATKKDPRLEAARREVLRRGRKYHGVRLFPKKYFTEWRKLAIEYYGADMKAADTKDEVAEIIISVIESHSKHTGDFELEPVESNLEWLAYDYRFYTDVAYAYPQLRVSATQMKKRVVEMAAEKLNLDQAGLPKIVPFDPFNL